MTAPAQQLQGTFFGWRLVGALGVILFFTGGGGFYVFPVYIESYQAEFGWTMTEISTAAAAFAIVMGISGPLVGVLFARFGARATMLMAAAMVVLTTAGYASLRNLTMLYLLMIGSGFGVAGTTLLPAQTLVTNWFDVYRGRALGLVMLGIGFGGVQPGEAGVKAPTAPVMGLAVRRAVRTETFWLLVGVFLLQLIGLSALNFHFVPFAIKQGGFTSQEAAFYYGLTLGFSIVGRCFGELHFSKIMGLVMSGFALGIILGIPLAGRIFDRTGSYELVLILCTATLLLSAILAALIQPKRYHPAFEAETPQTHGA